MQLCAICGKPSETLTRDHVPPKALFGKPLPNNLITVPACPKCNQESSGDDEYFRLLAVEWKATQIGDGIGVSSSILRSLEKSEARQFRHSVLSTIKWVLVETKSGLLVPSFAITVKMERAIVKCCG